MTEKKDKYIRKTEYDIIIGIISWACIQFNNYKMFWKAVQKGSLFYKSIKNTHNHKSSYALEQFSDDRSGTFYVQNLPCET